MAENNGVGNKLILGFVMLMIGTILIGVIANQSNARTTTTFSGNETQAILMEKPSAVNATATYTITNYPTSWKTTDCPITSFLITNTSGGAGLTSATDYVFTASTGTWVMVNNSATIAYINYKNTTQIKYYYCGDDYLNSGWGRTVLNLVGGFFAIALMLTAVTLFYSVAKDTGII